MLPGSFSDAEHCEGMYLELSPLIRTAALRWWLRYTQLKDGASEAA